MIATAQNQPPSLVFDANGIQWKYMCWVNTETGEGETFAFDGQGQKILNASITGVVKNQVKLAAPVLLVPVNPKYKTRAEWNAAMECGNGD